MNPPSNQPPGFQIIPDDEEFVDRIAQLIPLEAADRESLKTLIAGHRLMHAARSPSGEMERQMQLMLSQVRNLNRVVHNLVTQLGGTATVKDADIPFDWNLELEPMQAAQALRITANRCPPPDVNPAQDTPPA